VTIGSRIALESRTSSTTTTTTTTSRTSSTTTTTTVVAGTTCLAQDFTGVFNEGEGAAGTIYASVTLTKNTSGSCTLTGWPLLTLQNKLGAVLALNAVDVPSSGTGFQFLSSQANSSPTKLTLSQNQAVEFSLAYSDVQTGAAACESVTTISVQLAAKGAAITVTPTYPLTPCNSGQIWLSPFY
jgi:hypothetical protein